MFFLVADIYGYVDWAVINSFVMSKEDYDKILPFHNKPHIFKTGTEEEMQSLLDQIPLVLSDAFEWSSK